MIDERRSSGCHGIDVKEKTLNPERDTDIESATHRQTMIGAGGAVNPLSDLTANETTL